LMVGLPEGDLEKTGGIWDRVQVGEEQVVGLVLCRREVVKMRGKDLRNELAGAEARFQRAFGKLPAVFLLGEER